MTSQILGIYSLIFHPNSIPTLEVSLGKLHTARSLDVYHHKFKQEKKGMRFQVFSSKIFVIYLLKANLSTNYEFCSDC